MEYTAAILLGLLGSLHCAGMCGPLALALPQTSGSRISYGTGRLAYNAGRVATYMAMGVVFGLLGKTLVMAGVQRWVSIVVGVVLLAGLLASRKLALWRPATLLVNRLKTAMGALLRQSGVWSLGLLGLLNGLLPCGLVYVAGAAATTTGSVLGAVTYMALFGLGTVPMMLAISLSGRLVPVTLRLRLLKAVPAAVALLAVLLILRGMGLGIPYVSPALSSGTPACCDH